MYQTSWRKSLIINGALGRHGEGRYGGWGDWNEFSEGALEEMVMMRGKNKKAVRLGSRTAENNTPTNHWMLFVLFSRGSCKT